LVLFRDPHSCIFDCNLNILILAFLHNFYLNVDLASLCELESIRLKTEKDLHDPLLIRIDHVVMLTILMLVVYLMLFIVYHNIDESSMQPNFIILCLPLLDQHHFLYSRDDVELHDILPKLA
jgi:hypothetical protein